MENKKNKKKNPILKEILIDLLILVCVFMFVKLITTYVGQQTVVDGRSMEATLHNKDRVITDKISYRFHDPKRFDIIILKHPSQKNTYYVKRIIGLPNETIRINHEGQIFVNEQLLDENFGKEKILNPGLAFDSITLGEDEYFVLGDNRNHSLDSRFEDLKNVRKEQIIGKTSFRIFPFSQIGRVQ